MALIMVDMEEAARRLDQFVDAVATAGAEVIIGRDGRPRVRLVRFESPGKAGAPAAGAGFTRPMEDQAAEYTPDHEISAERVVGVMVS